MRRRVGGPARRGGVGQERRRDGAAARATRRPTATSGREGERRHRRPARGARPVDAGPRGPAPSGRAGCRETGRGWGAPGSQGSTDRGGRDGQRGAGRPRGPRWDRGPRRRRPPRQRRTALPHVPVSLHGPEASPAPGGPEAVPEALRVASGSARQERQPHRPHRVVAVGVDQAHRLPGAQRRAGRRAPGPTSTARRSPAARGRGRGRGCRAGAASGRRRAAGRAARRAGRCRCRTPSRSPRARPWRAAPTR